MEQYITPRKALRIKSVIERTGVSKTHLYRLINANKFPRPVKVSEGVSVWDSELIDQWLSSKFEEVKV
ncbi:AlpA family phage regulatory protein [Limnohabitans sp. Rim8]|jgi:prophage regulatory protein|uniref:helix-turn-helix transcriptional regulator n=1 Tax=Limnohabitans sp. Rim8 TaxID=1100718 RepID=UPI0033058240